MNDTELADKVVALLVTTGRFSAGSDGTEWGIADDGWYWLGEDAFVRDPRVAMALMERCDDGEFTIWQQTYSDGDSDWIVETHLSRAEGRSDSLPRAIIEACCLALEEK